MEAHTPRPILKLLGACLALWLASGGPVSGPAGAQVIRLRRPASHRLPGWLTPAGHPAGGHNIRNEPAAHSQKAAPPEAAQPAPPGAAADQTQTDGQQQPRPGNVVVHFDQNHQIQTIEYMLKDGSLATVYSRANKSAESARAGTAAGEAAAAGAAKEPAAGQVHATTTIDFEDGEHLDGGGGGGESEAGEILGHLGADALRAGLRGDKMRNLMNKIKAKLDKLPRMLEAKLRAKSTHGTKFVDRPPPAPDAERTPIGEGRLPNLAVLQQQQQQQQLLQEQQAQKLLQPATSSDTKIGFGETK
jgi:hypothetical protein